MSDLTVIVPSRNRPEAVAELARAFADTCTSGAFLLVAIDADDPKRGDYLDLALETRGLDVVIQPAGGTMVSALNLATGEAVRTSYATGFMGDDHRPRTRGWDTDYLEALRDLGTGIVYGNDLLQGPNLPTQCAMTSDIIAELGWMSPPDLVHMYVDNWWLQLGQRAGCIRYLPDVVVEHMHPVAGKADWDEGHQRVNAPAVYARDEATFRQLQIREMPRAVAAVRRLRQNRTARVRLRPVHTPARLGQLYAEPHDHTLWPDHVLRVDATIAFAREHAGPVDVAADLSCGSGAVLNALDAKWRLFGDYAPGYEYEGPIETTIGLIPHVDLFVCTETLEHVDDPDALLRLIRGKTDQLILSTPVDAWRDPNEEHYWAWSVRDIETMLRQAGFTVAASTVLDFTDQGCDYYRYGLWLAR